MSNSKLSKFLDENNLSTPCLVMDLSVIDKSYKQMTNLFPKTKIYYAVKANSAPKIIDCLKNNGSYLNNKRIRVSKKNRINECLFVTSGKIDNQFELPIRKTGCAALDLAYVASGKLDGFWGHGLKPWDRLAGQFIAQNEGALISSFDGIPDSYGCDNLIVSTPKCFKELSVCVKVGYQSKE